MTDADISEICATFASLGDPTLARGEDDDSIRGVFARILYEQFPYQQSLYEEITRTYALFGPRDDLRTRVLSPGTWEKVLGCSLLEFIACGDVFSAGARNSEGYFDLAWLEQGNLRPVVEELNADTIIEAMTHHFGTTREAFKDNCQAHTSSDPAWRRYDFNPLRATPFVLVSERKYLAPVLNLVPQKVSPEALFYEGVSRLGNAFSDDVGIVLEEYVGDQLRLIPANVAREIVYNRGQAKSVDWFVIFEDVVLLIEVKATRLTQEARMGRVRLDSDIQRAVGKAFTQISRTETLIGEAHPDFHEIPNDRPRLGLVVTLEPYWMANSPFVREILPPTLVPTIACSIRELEQYVALAMQGNGAKLLTDIIEDDEKKTWGLGNALPPNTGPTNPILKAAWNQLPWRDTARRHEQANEEGW